MSPKILYLERFSNGDRGEIIRTTYPTIMRFQGGMGAHKFFAQLFSWMDLDPLIGELSVFYFVYMEMGNMLTKCQPRKSSPQNPALACDVQKRRVLLPTTTPYTSR